MCEFRCQSCDNVCILSVMASTHLRTPSQLQDFCSALIASFAPRRNYSYVLSQELTTSNTTKVFRLWKGIPK